MNEKKNVYDVSQKITLSEVFRTTKTMLFDTSETLGVFDSLYTHQFFPFDF